MQLRNFHTYRGLLSFRSLSDADIQLTDCWRHGVKFGQLYIIKYKNQLFSVSSDDWLMHLACKSHDLLKFINQYKNNSYRITDVRLFINKFPQIFVVKYVSESIKNTK